MVGTPYVEHDNDEKTLVSLFTTNPAVRGRTCPRSTNGPHHSVHRDVEAEPHEIEVQSGTAIQELHHHIYTRWYAPPGFDWSRRSTSQAIIALVRRERSVCAGYGECYSHLENSRQDVPRHLE